MKINKKLLGFGTLALPIVVAASMFFAINPNMKLVNKAFAGDGTSDYSITFNRTVSEFVSDSTNKVYKAKSTSSIGNDIFLITTKCTEPASSALATVPSKYDQETLIPSVKFYLDNDGENQVKSQNILSVSVKTSKDITITINASSDGTHFYKKDNITASTSGATFSSFDKKDRYLEITVEKDNRPASTGYIREVILSYSCNNSYLPYSFTEGTFAGKVVNNAKVETDISIEFYSDNTGFYFYKNTSASDGATYQTAFTWIYDASKENINITFASGGTGNNTAYQGCRLLYSFSSGKTNTIALIDDTVSVFLYSGTTESTIWSTPTIMTK